MTVTDYSERFLLGETWHFLEYHASLSDEFLERMKTSARSGEKVDPLVYAAKLENAANILKDDLFCYAEKNGYLDVVGKLDYVMKPDGYIYAIGNRFFESPRVPKNVNSVKRIGDGDFFKDSVFGNTSEAPNISVNDAFDIIMNCCHTERAMERCETMKESINNLKEYKYEYEYTHPSPVTEKCFDDTPYGHMCKKIERIIPGASKYVIIPPKNNPDLMMISIPQDSHLFPRNDQEQQKYNDVIRFKIRNNEPECIEQWQAPGGTREKVHDLSSLGVLNPDLAKVHLMFVNEVIQHNREKDRGKDTSVIEQNRPKIFKSLIGSVKASRTRAKKDSLER